MLTEKKIKSGLSLAACLIVCMMVIGCSAKHADTNEVPVSAIEEQIRNAVPLEHMVKGDFAKLTKLYDVNEDEVEEFVLYTAESNVEANELAVIKVKHEDRLERVKENILKRIEAQKIKLKDYRPEQFFLVEKHVLTIKGLVVLFTVSPDAEQIEDAFIQAFKTAK
jgi:DNA-binding protein